MIPKLNKVGFKPPRENVTYKYKFSEVEVYQGSALSTKISE
jgi:hypothetical protein